MKKLLLMTVMTAILAGPVLAEDLNDPPWAASLPGQTSQAWEFAQLTSGLQPFDSQNPYGTAELQSENLTWPDPVEGPTFEIIDTLHIDAPGGLTIWIPNDPIPHLFKQIFWQITSDKSPTPTGTGPSTTTPGGSTGTNLPSPYPQIQHPNGTWYTYNGLIEIRPNPIGEWIHFDFLESTNISEIVIDTISIPEPATLAVLLAGGVLALTRRK